MRTPTMLNATTRMCEDVLWRDGDVWSHYIITWITSSPQQHNKTPCTGSVTLHICACCPCPCCSRQRLTLRHTLMVSLKVHISHFTSLLLTRTRGECVWNPSHATRDIRECGTETKRATEMLYVQCSRRATCHRCPCIIKFWKILSKTFCTSNYGELPLESRAHFILLRFNIYSLRIITMIN